MSRCGFCGGWRLWSGGWIYHVAIPIGMAQYSAYPIVVGLGCMLRLELVNAILNKRGFVIARAVTESERATQQPLSQ